MFLLFVVMVVCLCQTNGEDKFKCPPEEIDKFDVITARVISFTNDQRKLPDSKAVLPKFCSETKTDITDANDIVQKCFTGSAKQFATIIIFSVKKTINLYCSPRAKKRQDNLIAMAKCVSKNEPASRKCLTAFNDVMLRGKRAEIVNSRIGYACCDYYKFLNCMENITRQNCSQKASNAIQEFVRNIFQSVVDVACGSYIENSDSCEKLKVPPKKKKTDKDARTVFLTLVHLWNNL